jgi:hypothetical protein
MRTIKVWQLARLLERLPQESGHVGLAIKVFRIAPDGIYQVDVSGRKLGVNKLLSQEQVQWFQDTFFRSRHFAVEAEVSESRYVAGFWSFNPEKLQDSLTRLLPNNPDNSTDLKGEFPNE